MEVPHRAGRNRPRRSPLAFSIRRSCECMEGFLIRRCGRTLPCFFSFHELQTTSSHAISQVGLGFPHRAGRYRPGRSLISSPVRLSSIDVEISVNRGRDPILPKCGATVTFPRPTTLVERPAPPHWMIVGVGTPLTNGVPGKKWKQPTGLGFPHRADRHYLGGHPFRPRFVGFGTVLI